MKAEESPGFADQTELTELFVVVCVVVVCAIIDETEAVSLFFCRQGFCENTGLHDQDPKDQQCFQVLDVQH